LLSYLTTVGTVDETAAGQWMYFRDVGGGALALADWAEFPV